MRKYAPLSLVVFSLFCGDVFAEDLKVMDCQGTDRAMKHVEPASHNTVELRLSLTPTEPITVILSTQEKTLEGSSSGNKVTFKEVLPGDWKACIKDENADSPNITQVAIFADTEAAKSTQALWLGGAGMAASGLGFGVLAGSSSDSDNASGNGGTTGLNAGEEPEVKELRPFRPDEDAARPIGERFPTKPPCAAEEACLNNELPPPLSPIS